MMSDSAITLELQSSSVRFNLKHHTKTQFIKILEFCMLTFTEDFYYLTQEKLCEGFVGTLWPENDENALSFFESFRSRNLKNIKETKKGVMLVCDSNEENYNYIYLILYSDDPFIKRLKLDDESLGLFKVDYNCITNGRIEIYESIINQLKDVQNQMRHIVRNMNKENERSY